MALVSHSRRLFFTIGLLGALALVVVASVLVGAKFIPFNNAWQAIWGSGELAESAIIFELRLPRTWLGLVAGAALGLSGALMQSLTRNPLAEPGLLGVNSGAAAAIVVGISAFGITQPSNYIWFALVGAGLAAAAVYLLGSRGVAGQTPVKLVLAGAAISAVLMAVVWGVTLLDSAALDHYRFWVLGSLTGRDAGVLAQVLPFIIGGGILALALSWPLNIMAFGDDVSRGLGLNPTLIRAIAAVAVTLLCGAATAAVGPIAFLGLAVPHAVRALTGPDDRWVLPLSTLTAPVLLLGADVLGRVLVSPDELQVGVVTAFLGAPVLIALVTRRKPVRL